MTERTMIETREPWFDENRLVASVVAFVGLIGVIVGITDPPFGAAATIALLMLVAGVAGVVWPRAPA